MHEDREVNGRAPWQNVPGHGTCAHLSLHSRHDAREHLEKGVLRNGGCAVESERTASLADDLGPGAREVHTNDDAICCDPEGPSAAQIIRQRRSALAFDGTTAISQHTFFKMFTRVMLGVEREVRARAMPWDVLPWRPAIHLAIFVHRVEGLVRGLHLLARDPAQVESLRGAMHPHFDWTSPAGCPDGLPFFLLQKGDARALAAELSCGQDIAGAGAFSLAMIAEFDRSLRRHGPW